MTRASAVRPLGVSVVLALCALGAGADTMQLWPEGRVPDLQPHQTTGSRLDWYEAPAGNRSGSCMILISGGGYQNLADGVWVEKFAKYFTDRGIQCVSLTYRTPRPKGLPIYQSGWEDGQRAVRIVRSEAKRRGFDPERIGALGFSAGAHLTVMLATSSQTPAYGRVDELDDVPCHINLAIPVFTAYALADGLEGPNAAKGDDPGVALNPSFRFDAKTCPMCLIHGSDDIYSSVGSLLIYRQLHRMGISSDLHVYADRGHGFLRDNALLRVLDRWIDRTGDFLREKGFGDVRPAETGGAVLEHIAIVVKDPAAMVAWWERNLGFRTTLRRPGGSAFIVDGSGRIAFEVYGPQKDCPAPDYSKMPILQLHFGFHSDDVEADIRRLLAAGATMVVRENAPGLEGAILRDPFGIPIQLMKREKPVTL